MRLGNIQALVGISFRFAFLKKNTEKVEKSQQKTFLRLGRKSSLGSVLIPFRFVSIFSESNQIGSIDIEKMQIVS